MDGRVLPVLLGITGHPPKTYRIPVPAPDGGPPTVLVYRRVPRAQSGLGLTQGWKYAVVQARPRAGRHAGRQAGRRRRVTPLGRTAHTRRADRARPSHAHGAGGRGGRRAKRPNAAPAHRR
jgi:hypothetical protein